MNLSAWIAAHKPQAAIGGLAGVGGIALYMRHRAAASGGAPAPASLTGSSPAGQSSGFDTSQLDQYNQLAGAISQQNDQISTLGAELTQLATAQIPSAPTPTGSKPTTTSVLAPPAGWMRIPNPTIGSELAAAGVSWKTVGNAQYYDPTQLVHILNPAQGSMLTNEGYKAVTIGNAQYYNPAQKR